MCIISERDIYERAGLKFDDSAPPLFDSEIS